MKWHKNIKKLVYSPGIRAAGIYTFSNFFAKATGFLLLFLYSNPKYISVDENGLLSLLNSSVYILMPFLSLGIIQSTSTDYFKLDKKDFRDFFTSSFVMPAATMLLAAGVLYFFKEKIKLHFGLPFSFVWMIPVLAFLNFCYEQYIALIRNRDEPVRFLKSSMLRLFLEIGISVTLVVAVNWRWQGRVAGILVANGVLLIIALVYFSRNDFTGGKVKKKYLRQELIYAVPIIAMQASTFCLAYSDKFFLSFFSDNIAVGIYAYACVFSSLVSVACSALISYVMPKVYAALAKKETDYAAIKRYFKFYLVGCGLAWLGVIVSTPLLYRLFINQHYYPGLSYFYLIATGYLLWSITYFFYLFFLFNKQKKVILLLSIVAALVSLANNYFFIMNGGAFGAAISVCCSYLLVLIITLVISRQRLKALFSTSKRYIIPE